MQIFLHILPSPFFLKKNDITQFICVFTKKFQKWGDFNYEGAFWFFSMHLLFDMILTVET